MSKPQAIRVAHRYLEALQIGQTVENEGLRIHLYRDSVQVTDLTWAGKRGKKVDRFTFSGTHNSQDPDMDSLVQTWLAKLPKETSYKRALGYARMMSLQATDKGLYGFNVYESQEKGVHVAPAGFGPIEINGKNVYIKADWSSFTVRDKADQYNLPTCIPAIKGGKKDIKVFYRWVKDNQAKLRSMTYHEVLKGMRTEGIRSHSYCAMD